MYGTQGGITVQFVFFTFPGHAEYCSRVEIRHAFWAMSHLLRAGQDYDNAPSDVFYRMWVDDFGSAYDRFSQASADRPH